MLEKVHNYFDLVFGTFLWVIISGFALCVVFIAFIIYLIID